jgi:hypothetical protein
MAFSGQQSFSGTLVASTAQAVNFGYAGNNTPIRYAYVYVENTGTAGNIYVRTDGTAATVGGDFTTEIAPGSSAVIANALPLWTQASSVIPVSTSGAGAYTNASGNGPLGVTPMGTSPPPSGATASPGTSVSVIGAGTNTFTVTGTG